MYTGTKARRTWQEEHRFATKNTKESNQKYIKTEGHWLRNAS